MKDAGLRIRAERDIRARFVEACWVAAKSPDDGARLQPLREIGYPERMNEQTGGF